VTVKGIQNAIEIFTKAFLCRLWCLKIPASTGSCHMILTSQKSKMVDHLFVVFFSKIKYKDLCLWYVKVRKEIQSLKHFFPFTNN
jgi:hypothetical protein